MRSFSDLDRLIGSVPSRLVSKIAAIERGVGQEASFADQLPGLLTQLSQQARVDSVKASSAIEGVVVEEARAERIITGAATHLRTRDEKELAGYRDALDYLFGEDDPGPTSVGLVLHLHRTLFSHTAGGGGRFKSEDNAVVDRLPDGTLRTRFRPVSARETPFHVDELVSRYNAARVDARHHPVLLTGLFALDLLVIHPFEDGNGRVTRVLTTAQLADAGLSVGRYVSLEQLMDATRDDYYDSLEASTRGWFGDSHDPWPWLEYFAGTVETAYERFAARASAGRGDGTKQDHVKEYVQHHAAATFAISDVRRALLGVSDQTIRLALWELRDAGELTVVGSGRGTRWEKKSR
jgi:Fic family protein